MLTDPCPCGVKPTSHTHIVNSKDKDAILWFKGIPIIKDNPKVKDFYILKNGRVRKLSTRREGKLKKV